MGFLDKLLGKKAKPQLEQGLEKTREGLFGKLTRLLTGKTGIDDAMLDDLEELLITADVGIETTSYIIDNIKQRAKKENPTNTEAIDTVIKEEIAAILHDAPSNSLNSFENLPTKPYVIMVVGVNGVGKTTTIGKLAYQFKQAGHQVLLGAADTFRAAAVDQLTIWSERIGVPIVKQSMGSDPAAVAFDTVQSGVSKQSDVIIIDTAGRLHNKAHLMDELSKIKRVMQKTLPEAPHEVLLVLDGSTGQNALQQAKQFSAATPISGLAITKLDGTAKGGAVLAIAHQMKVPVKFIGVGEQMEDLLLFDKTEFAAGLLAK
jgi:fused signal recognition particle receptor